MATRLSAVLDQNIVYVEYYFDPQDVDNSVADVTISLFHEYEEANGTAQEVLLKQFVVPGSYLRSLGEFNTNESFHERSSIRILNPRYSRNLIIQAAEIRNGVPVTTRVPVLDQPDDPELASNPIKEPFDIENLPATKPHINVIDQSIDIDPVIYSMRRDGVRLLQSSARVLLGERDEFIRLCFGEEPHPILVENQITNMLPNPWFRKTSHQKNGPPDDYLLYSPSFVLNQFVDRSNLPDIHVFHLRGSLPSFLSAFNTMSLQAVAPITIPQGLEYLTSSVYYRITSQCGKLPFNNVIFRLSFFDSNNQPAGTSAIEVPVTHEGMRWQLAQATETSIPISAVSLKWSFESDAVESSDAFDFQVVLPQLEPQAVATTRSLEPRVQDVYQSNCPISCKPPFYLKVRTVHAAAARQRGLLCTTVNGHSGYQFSVTGNQLQFRVFDSQGSQILSVFSNVFTAVNASLVDYGVYVDGEQASFYLDNMLISTTPAIFTQTSTNRIILGALETSGTTVDGPLLECSIFRDPPGA